MSLRAAVCGVRGGAGSVCWAAASAAAPLIWGHTPPLFSPSLYSYACFPDSTPILSCFRLPEDEIEEKLTAYRAELTAKFAEQAAAAGAAGAQAKDRCVAGVAGSGWSGWLAGQR